MLDPEPGADTTFKLPSDPAYREELMAAINSASAKHQCDPLLVLSVLHSESAGFVNGPENKDAAKAMGVAQITPGTWGIWWTGGCHQPPTFTAPEAKPGLDKRADINLSVDAACRLILWTDMQAYPEDNGKFVTSFAIRGGNFYGQIWNFHTPQADYVYRLWQELRNKTGRPAMAPQSGYPGTQCS